MRNVIQEPSHNRSYPIIPKIFVFSEDFELKSYTTVIENLFVLVAALRP